MRNSVGSSSPAPALQRTSPVFFSSFIHAPRSGKARKTVKVLLILFILLLGYQFFSSHHAFFSALYKDRHRAPASGEVSVANSEVGSEVLFGRYPREIGEAFLPIEWIVLDNDGKQALLVTKDCLESKPFNSNFIDTNWRDCDLRKWLNSDFFNRAFNAREKHQIVESSIYTDDNPDFGTKGCGKTIDAVFCLSIKEANKFFNMDADRQCRPTRLAIFNSVYCDNDSYCWFWLRSPGCDASNAAIVFNDGAVDSDGYHVSAKDIGVRPALRIKLK